MKMIIEVLKILILVNCCFIFSCKSETNKIDKSIEENLKFSLDNIQEFTKYNWGETRSSLNIYVRESGLEEKIQGTVLGLLITSDRIEESLSKKKFDCHTIISELNDSYDVIKSQLGTAIDSLRLKAKIKDDEFEEFILRSQNKTGSRKIISEACDRSNIHQYLYPELIRFNSFVNLFVNEIRLMFPRVIPEFKAFPVVLLKKPYYKAG